MSETENLDHLPPSRLPIVLLHCAQLLLAIIILAIDANGIHYVVHNVLIYSLVTGLCTILVCTYLLLSQSILPKLYNIYVALGLHIWMLIFWSVNLGLIAYMADLWKQPQCTSGSGEETQCMPYGKRDPEALHKRGATLLVDSGTLIAGAILAAFGVIFWTVTTCILLVDEITRRSLISNQDGRPPPRAPGEDRPEAVQSGSSRAYQEHWDTASAASIPRPTAQPILPSPEDPNGSQQSSSSYNSLTPEPLSFASPREVPHFSSELENHPVYTNLELHPEVPAVHYGPTGDFEEALPPCMPRRLQSLSELFVVNTSETSLASIEIHQDRGDEVHGAPASL